MRVGSSPFWPLKAASLFVLATLSMFATSAVADGKLPTTGDVIQIVHPRNDTKFGEIIILHSGGRAEIDRSGSIREGSWKQSECGFFTSYQCVKIESTLSSGTVLKYDLERDGSMVAKPSSHAGWKWRRRVN